MQIPMTRQEIEQKMDELPEEIYGLAFGWFLVRRFVQCLC